MTILQGISKIPEAAGFEPRPADPRVGYLTTDFRDYSNEKLMDVSDPRTAFINRWHLEKSVPEAAVSDVKNPIVWWIDENVPTEYRGAVASGILAWNAAFEAVGLRNALVVKEVDKDMTPAQRAVFNPVDAANNVVRWVMGLDSNISYAVIRANPFSGQIYSAAVQIRDVFSRVWDELSFAVVGSDFAQNRLTSLVKSFLAAEKSRLINERITDMLGHEIGHTLGLRHNFKGSLLYDIAEIGKDGLRSASLMDYLPEFGPGAGYDPRIYSQTKPGPYDEWAIEYGYKPLPGKGSDELLAIARRANDDPRLAYASDGEANRGIDPDAQKHDIGRDPIKYAQRLARQASAIWDRTLAQDSGSDDLPPMKALNQGLFLYQNSVQAILPLIGGVRSDRRPESEGGPRQTTVPADEQRAALNYFDEKIFSRTALNVPEELSRKASWDPNLAGTGRGYNDIFTDVERIQKSVLDQVFGPAVLKRIAVAEQVDPRNALPMAELFSHLRHSIWSETQSRAAEVKITAMRRQLQALHVRKLMELTENAAAPFDAVSLARADLKAIDLQAKNALARTKDPIVKAYLEETHRKIAHNLDEPSPVKRVQK